VAEQLEKTLFQRALLASRLVDAAELVEVALRLPTDPPEPSDADTRIARRLVERGLLNAWQVEQLRAGRTKFTLGPYLIVDAIGKGGMGHVFKGRHELLGRIEAIKVLPKSRSSQHAVENFQHEIRAQAQLDHPNLVRVSYADKDGDTYFLVTEFVPGVDLRKLVRKCGPLPADQAAVVIAQAADALDYAHHRGLVHRDVKPGNLLLRPDGLVKVTDLGLAWYLDDSLGASPAGQGKVVGTCDYLPPESIEEPDCIIPVSDIYSLGCTLYYAVTGKVPFPGGNANTKIQRQLRAQPIEPRAFNSDLPAGLAALIAEMMAKDHAERTPSAAIVSRRLRQFIRDNSQQGLAATVVECQRGATTRTSSAGEGRSQDIGETLVTYSDDDLGLPDSMPEPPSQASQGTDPIAGAAVDTQVTASWPEVGPARANSRRGHSAARSANHSGSVEHVAPRSSVLVRVTATVALVATFAILAASLLQLL